MNIKQIGKYQIEELDFSFDDENNQYKLINIIEFNEKNKQVQKKFFYILFNHNWKEIYSKLETEHKINDFMNYPNYSKFEFVISVKMNIK